MLCLVDSLDYRTKISLACRVADAGVVEVAACCSPAGVSLWLVISALPFGRSIRAHPERTSRIG